MQKTDVLICGAGPTGLVLALWLTKAGISVRIFDKTAGPGTTSRALVLHARNLEFYHQMGIDRVAIDHGIEFTSGNLWVGGKKKGHVQFGDPAAHISPYPYAIILPQDRHEELLVAELEKLGVHVGRNTELLSFTQAEDGIAAMLRSGGGDETCEARYLAGCDGAHSLVREAIGAGFPGGTYDELFYVADLQIKGPVADGEFHMALDSTDFLAIFPMQGQGRVRVVGAVNRQGKDQKGLKWDDVSSSIIQRLDMQVEEVKWFSTYRVHHRVASFFRKGNAFLLGDAGHLHSPVGGQGMNTGIGDAINLAWKISAVIKGQIKSEVLDTYGPERMAFARELVATTDKAFTFINKKGPLATFVRTRIVPNIIPKLFRFAKVRRTLFGILSQTNVRYPGSPLSAGQAGSIKGGDRLPWVQIPAGNDKDNYENLTSMDWQVHCYGTVNGALQQLCAAKGIPLHVYSWNDEMDKKGLKKDAACIIRPDGYVGLAAPTGGADDVIAYFKQWGIGKPEQ